MKSLHVYWLAWKGFGDELYPCNHKGSTVIDVGTAVLEFSKENLLHSVVDWMPSEVDSPNTPWSIQTFTLELDNE